MKLSDSIGSSIEAYFSHGFHQRVLEVIFFFFYLFNYFMVAMVVLPTAMSVHHVNTV